MEEPRGPETSRANRTELETLRGAVSRLASSLLGTEVASNAPLMSVGLDSLGATELTSAIGDELGTSVAAILLFDHPTVDAVASHLALEAQIGDVEGARSRSFARVT